MGTYRYSLTVYKGRHTRFICPNCKTQGSYSRYFDFFKQEYLPYKYGRCNREIKCGYHLNPYKDGYGVSSSENDLSDKRKQWEERKISNDTTPSFIPKALFTQTLHSYEENRFINFLHTIFPVETVDHLITLYQIGTAKCFPGGTIFWQIDTIGNVRTGKIMQYDPITGHRIKEPRVMIHWVHKLLNKPEFQLQQCLFGEHLLKDFDSIPVAIVESEKTAVICSEFRPDSIWLATGSLGNLSDKLCKVLTGREVTLFPDKNGYIAWSQKAEKLKYIKNLKISDFLENLGEQIEKGRDLADYFLEGK